MLWSSEDASLLAESPEDVEGFGRPGVEVIRNSLPTRSIEGFGLPSGPLQTRAMRGTAGTFAGQRPPKSPARLAQFLQRRAMAEAQRAVRQHGRKQSQSSSSSKYQNFISKFMKSDSLPGSCSKDKFKAAAAAWIATQCDGIGLKERSKAASAKRQAESKQRRAVAAASRAASLLAQAESKQLLAVAAASRAASLSASLSQPQASDAP